jgi:hypothetical protein
VLRLFHDGVSRPIDVGPLVAGVDWANGSCAPQAPYPAGEGQQPIAHLKRPPTAAPVGPGVT